MILSFKGALSAALVLALTGCEATPFQEGSSMQSATTQNSAEILKRIGLVLPASATLKYAAQEPGMDDSAHLLVTMSTADWAAFLLQIAHKTPRELTFSESDNFLLGTEGEHWKLSATAGLKTGQVPWANQTQSLNIGFAPAEADKVEVFIFWHQT